VQKSISTTRDSFLTTSHLSYPPITYSNPDLSRGTSGSDTHESDGLYSTDCDLPQGFFAAFYHMLHDALCGPCADGKVSVYCVLLVVVLSLLGVCCGSVVCISLTYSLFVCICMHQKSNCASSKDFELHQFPSPLSSHCTHTPQYRANTAA